MAPRTTCSSRCIVSEPVINGFWNRVQKSCMPASMSLSNTSCVSSRLMRDWRNGYLRVSSVWPDKGVPSVMRSRMSGCAISPARVLGCARGGT